MRKTKKEPPTEDNFSGVSYRDFGASGGVGTLSDGFLANQSYYHMDAPVLRFQQPAPALSMDVIDQIQAALRTVPGLANSVIERFSMSRAIDESGSLELTVRCL